MSDAPVPGAVPSADAKKPRSALRWLLIGCAAPVLLGGLCIGGLFAYVFQSLRSSDACNEAMAKARSHPDLIAALGQPVEKGWLVTGVIQRGADVDRVAKLSIPVSGPRGEGTLTVEGIKSGPFWYFPKLELSVASGKTFDLRKHPEPAGGVGRLSSDSFGDPHSGWSTRESEIGGSAYEDGRLVLRASPGTLVASTNPGGFENGTLRIDVSRAASAQAWIGIIVREQPSRLGCGFFFDGRRFVGAKGSGRMLPPFMLPGAQELPSDLQEETEYRIEVMAAGPELRFSINGRELWKEDNALQTKGIVSLALSVPPGAASAQVAFDDLVVLP
jgi:Cytochrome oxidase complex assembly protein 1